MNLQLSQKWDRLLGLIFALMTLGFIFLFMNNDAFFNWTFQRHHNILSWYARPLFILPIVFFAYKKSWTGVMASIFCLFTSMFWFPVPTQTSESVEGFLAYEMNYLKGSWDIQKIFASFSVPLFFILLIISAWSKSWKLLIGVVIAAAILKMLWSVMSGGPSGMAVLKPAISGLVICLVGFYIYMRRKKIKGDS